MEYYPQSQVIPVDPSNLSGGVAFNFNGAIGSIPIRSGGGGGYGGGLEPAKPQSFQKYTLDICVDGVAKKLDVYVAGEPY